MTAFHSAWRHSVGLFWGTVCLVVFVWPLSRVDASSSRGRCANNIRQLVLAVHNYCSANNDKFPTDICDESDRPLLSWRVRLLPFIEKDSLYRQIRLDEAWDSPHNVQFIGKCPGLYCCSAQEADFGNTMYLSIRADKHGGVRPVNLMSDSTIMLVEVDDAWAVPWSKPGDLPAEAATVRAALARRHSTGFPREPAGFVGFANSSWRLLPTSVDEELIQELLTVDSERHVSLPSLPWYAALSKESLAPILRVWFLITICMVSGMVLVVPRLLRGRSVSPGEALWCNAGVAYLVHLILVVVVYRYEPVPFSRDQVIFWSLPALVMTMGSSIPPTLFRTSPIWGTVFLLSIGVWLIVGGDAASPHEGRRVEESFVAPLAPTILAAMAGVVALLTLLRCEPNRWTERWRWHWTGIVVCSLPFLWFTICVGNGTVYAREFLYRIRD